MNRLFRLLLACVVLVVVGPGALAAASPTDGCPSCVADFAIYDTAYEDDGVWDEEVTAIKALLTRYGWTYQTVEPARINAGYLGTGASRRFRALIEPGGWAYSRSVVVTPVGEQRIREFVASGGGYVGLCAGAYYATAVVRWAQTASGGSGSYTTAADYTDYPYSLGLLSGIAQGPLGWAPWNDGKNPRLELATIDTANPTMAAIGMIATTRFFYAGGPFFTGMDPLPPGVEVWARAAMPAGTPSAASIGDGEPTIVRFLYGQGSVVLFSYHPTILVRSLVDNVTLSMYYDETTVPWDTGDQTWDEINFHSWNVVHAALQFAAGQTPTRIPPLPQSP